MMITDLDILTNPPDSYQVIEPGREMRVVWGGKVLTFRPATDEKWTSLYLALQASGARSV